MSRANSNALPTKSPVTQSVSKFMPRPPRKIDSEKPSEVRLGGFPIILPN
jgi:hypothetical protein